jgi:HlyD family secretion protein
LGYHRFFSAEAATDAGHTQTVTVQRGSLVSTVTTTGSVVAGQQAKLAFDTSGRLESISVNAGDLVSKGQVLAQIDASDLERNVAQAESTLRASELKLQQLQTGSTANDLAAAQANYDAAVAKLQQLQAGPNPDEIAAAQATYDAAVSQLNTLKAGPTADDLASVQAALEKAKVALQSAQTAYDRVGWRGPNDPQASAAAVTLQQATADYQAALSVYNQKTAGATPDQLASAEAAVLAAKAALDQKKQGATAEELKSAEAAVASAKAALEAKTTGATDTDIALAQETVKQSQIALETAQANLDGATLRAPFDGIIASVSGNVGEQVSSGTPIVTLIDPTTVRVDTTVDESDIAKVKVGQDAVLTIDSLPGVSLQGKVVSIAGSATVSSGVVTYVVSVGLSTPNDGTLKEGMTVAATITVASKDNVLMVPSRAVKTSGRNRVVEVVVNGKTEQRTVQVGQSNDQYVEITDGLQEGDQVLITATTAATTQMGNFGGTVGGAMPGLPIEPPR